MKVIVRCTNNRVTKSSDTRGIDVSDSGDGKLFNHIYSWTIPYYSNRLVYGEAGQAGEYKTTKVEKITGPLTIKLGVGGKWNDETWKQSKQGKDGTDTTVNMNNQNILTAKGGKGGSKSLYTNRYDLCYNKKDECKRTYETTNDKVSCCDAELGKRSTKEIYTTASKQSAFENIKALTGNSLIVGIGLGRGGEGAGSRAGIENLIGLRVFRNSSGHNIGYGSSSELKREEGGYQTDLRRNFTNYPLAPSELNFKGGDGAVIITW